MKMLRIKSTHRPALVTTPTRSKTLVVAGTIIAVNGEEWNHAYCAIMPGGAITLDDIEWEYASAPGGQHIQHPTVVKEVSLHEYTVQGRNGNVYQVLQFPNDKWTCSCPAFKYGKGKDCKHIEDYR